MQSNAKAREQLERSSWSWVDDIEDPVKDPISVDNLLSSYRLRFPVHSSPAWKCKRNCRSNPRCYCGLGEAQWIGDDDAKSDEKSAKNGVDDDDDDDDEEVDESLERRLAGLPAGLKNLGNTCYVNSFLQIWFHNMPFREALYEWVNREPDPAKKAADEPYRPHCKVASLQALFAMMEFSNRRAVDPNEFIAKLGLDPQVQQDAAEFSKLFMSLLESNLGNQENEKVRTIVQSQFRGEYAYVTRCCRCEIESERPSYFYELDLALQGQRTLANCLDEFLKEEKLEGDNQYFCEGCESKQDAARSVRLLSLPPVLNLQLNRFIFDMATGRKKKLNSFVHFPEVLDMSQYLRQRPDTTAYSLTGVLMHVGAEANHGHYIAHILDASTGQWFEFSDAHVEVLAGKNPKLGSGTDPLLANGTSTAAATVNGVGSKRASMSAANGGPHSSAGRGTQSSNNAYMLVYTLAGARPGGAPGTPPPPKRAKKCAAEGDQQRFVQRVPAYLRAYIEADRRLLDEDVQRHEQMKRARLKEQSSLRTKMRSLYRRLAYEADDNKFEFIPMEWLARYFSSPHAAPIIDVSQAMCVHGNLDLERIQDVKAVSSDVVDDLYKEAGNTCPSVVRMTLDSLCEHCVRNRCRQIKLVRSMNDDFKLLAELLKQPPGAADGAGNYWVGKVSLKRWRTMARENLEEKIAAETNKFVDVDEGARPRTLVEVTSKLSKVGTDVIVSGANGKCCQGQSPTDGKVGDGDKSDEEPGIDERFNFDIVCPHGNLCHYESKRRLVTAEIWAMLRRYFPKTRQFKESSPVCHLCIANDEEAKMENEARKELACSQKSSLNDILNERNRPTWSRPSLNKVYLIPRAFVFLWRSFVRNPSGQSEVKNINNVQLLCDEHEGLIYPLDLDTESDYESVVYMVSEDEWSILKDTFEVDREISVTRNKAGDVDCLLVSDPPVCTECLNKRCMAEEEKQLTYRNVTVYVRRLTGAERPPVKDPTDPDFDCLLGGGKRLKLSNGSALLAGSSPKISNGHHHYIVSNSTPTSEFVRRSNRRQKVRGEREFIVSSDMLLRDLKVKIMEVFKVAPFDQNLCLNGQYLTDSSQTLGQLRVLPKSLIYLRADEPNPNAASVEPDDVWLLNHPEEGFKGTGLFEGR